MTRSNLHAWVLGAAILMATAISITPVAAEDPPPPAIDELLRQSGDTSGVWEADKKNRAHHVQSGLICNATFVSLSTTNANRLLTMPLQSVSIVAGDRPRGDDVACNYGVSNGPLVVIEAIRVNKGEEANDVFEDMRKLLASKYDRFYHEDMILPVGAEAPGELAHDLKFQHFNARLGDKKYLATIWVGVVRGWAVVVYAVGISDNIFIQHGAVNAQWIAAAQSVVATSIYRGESAP